MTHRDDPEYRRLIGETIVWLADGRELTKLEEIVEEVKAELRSYSSSRYEVKNPDGSVAQLRQSRKAGASRQRQVRVVGVPRNPVLALAMYMREHDGAESAPAQPRPRRRAGPTASALHRRRDSAGQLHLKSR